MGSAWRGTQLRLPPAAAGLPVQPEAITRDFPGT